MKLLIYIVFGAIGVIALVVGVVCLIGAQLPQGHSVSRSILLHQSPQNIYEVMRDFASAPKWRSDVNQVDLNTPVNGVLQFRETGKNGTVNYALDEDMPGERMVTRIVDTNLGYSGKWLYVLADENGGTRVTITENGEVSNVFFRFMSRYVFGQTASMDSYLTSLATYFRETSKPQ